MMNKRIAVDLDARKLIRRRLKEVTVIAVAYWRHKDFRSRNHSLIDSSWPELPPLDILGMPVSAPGGDRRRIILIAGRRYDVQ
jgi:hypothetical protein